MADRSRSITWSDERRKMVNLVAAHYDMTTEAFIRACITSGLLSMGTSDRLLALALCEIAGIEIQDLNDIDSLNLDANGFGR